MAYNIKAALDAGFSEKEIADAIAGEKGLNAEAARQQGFSDREILSELTKPTPGIGETAYRGFRRSLGELGVLGGDVLPALAAGAVLPEETARPYVERQLGEAAQTRAELEERFPSVYKSYKDVEGLGSGIGYVSERFGELLPDIIPSIASGGIGYAVGRKAAVKAGEALARKTEMELLEGGIESTAKPDLYKGLADRIGREAAETLSKKYTKTGVNTGVFLGSYAQNAPEVFENIYEETGDIGAAGALLFGGLSAMLDSYLPAKVLDDLGAYGKGEIVAKMLKDSGANPAVWKSVLSGATKAAAGEGLTESAQEAISVAAEKFYGSNKDFFDPENVERYLESFFAGAAGGGVLGGISGAGRGMREKAIKRELDFLQEDVEPPPPGTKVTTPITPAGTPSAGAKATVSPLEGFDISKVEPAKVEAAQKFLEDLSGGTLVDLQGQPLSKLDANKKLQSVVRSLGIPLKKDVSKKTKDLEALLATALATKGVADATRTEQGTTGEGAQVLSGPGAAGAPGGPSTPAGGGVDVSAAGTAGAVGGEGAGTGALDAEEAKKAALKEAKARLAQAKANKKAVKSGSLEISDTFGRVPERPESDELIRLEGQIKNVRARLSDAVDKMEQSATDEEREANQKVVGEIEAQLQGMYDKYGTLTDKLTKTKTPAEETAGAFTYMPGRVTQEQAGVPAPRTRPEIDPELAAIEAEIRKVEGETEQIRLDKQLEQDYNTVYEDFTKVREEDLVGLTDKEKNTARKRRKALEKWSELSLDEKMVFEDALTYYETIPEALDELAAYRQMKGEKRGDKNTAAAAYEINRKAESTARDVEFPAWVTLPEEHRTLFTETAKAEQARLNALENEPTYDESDLRYKGIDFRAQQAGFDALQNVLGSRDEALQKERQDIITKNQLRNARLGLLPEQQKEAEELSLNQPIPDSILEAVFGFDKDGLITENGDLVVEGDLDTLLDYLSKQAKGVPKKEFRKNKLGDIFSRTVIDRTTSQINQIVAGQLLAVLGSYKDNASPVKLVYRENYSGIAEFNPKTNEIILGYRGLNETAVLHESTHAATVRVMFLYMDPKTRNKLTQEQQDAAQHILKLITRTAPSLKSKYRRAYKDVYEFIAFAMTDPKFQADLKNIELRPSEGLTKYSNLVEQEFPESGVFGPGMGNDTAYDSFARAIANALGLLNKFAKYVKNIFSYNPYFETTKKTDEEIDEQVADLTEELTGKQRLQEEKRITKDLEREIEDSDEAAKAQIALNRTRERYKRVSNKYKNQTKEELNQNKEYLDALAEYTAAQDKINEIKARVPDLTALGISATKEQGYLGNVLVEIAGAFDQILSAPPEGGVPNWDNKPLYVTATGGGMSAEEIEKRFLERLNRNDKSILSKVGSAIKNIFTKTGYENLVRTVQNKTVAFDSLRNLMRLRNQLIVVGGIDEYNDLATAYYSGTALAQNYMNKFVPLTNQATDLLQGLMKSMNLEFNPLLAKLHTYMVGLQEPERRHEIFLRSVPLSDNAATARQKIYDEVKGSLRKDILQAKINNDEVRLGQLKIRAENLRKQLEDIVYDRNIISGTTNRAATNDINTNNEFYSKYNSLGYDWPEVQHFKKQYDEARQKHPEIDQLFAVLQKVMDQTQKFNEETNYFNAGAQGVIWFYGWKSYFPFKGKPDPTGRLQEINALIDPYSAEFGGDFAQGENTIMGRQSDSDNPVLQIFTEATRSTMRKGYFMAPHAMKNLINQKRVAGEKLPTITFEERFTPGFKIKDKIPQNAFVVYQPDGSIDVYAINDPKMARAFKGTFTPDQPLIDAANKLTSAVGQFHTRYNPAFAPLDFTRNLMTYAGIVGFKYGPSAAIQMITAMSRVVAEGGMSKTFKYTMAYNKGDEKALEKLIGKDPDGFYKDIDDYYKLGGPVAYLQGLTNLQSQAELSKRLNRLEVAGMTGEDFSNFFDSWMAMFETTSRIAAFRVVKQQLRQQGITNEDELNQRAMAEAKELANFQKVGQFGKELGAAFMFWRPAATGAVTAINAILPAFDTRSDADLFKYYKEQAGAGETTDEEAQAAVRQHLLERRNARVMGYALIGAGMFTYLMAYMLAGEDEEERNKVATDDMARWVRFLRINTGIEVGGKDLVFQWAWGFGPGALASAGAQIMATAMGNQSFMSMANNIMDAGFESFVPLPISKIDKFANPSAAAVDSLTPSVLRPFLQYAMNIDGLGRRIYSDRQSRYGDAFLGSDNVPAVFTDIARGVFELTGGKIDWSPSTLYFFANNYVDGASRAVSTTYNVSQIMAGNKEFDPRTDTFFLDSYLKAPSNYDAIEFSKAENKIKEIEKTLNSIKGTPAYADYLAENPMDKRIVDFYNKTVNGNLRNLRTRANEVRRNTSLSISERQDQLQLLIKQQNQIKSAFTTAIRGLSDDFASFGYED